jgi:hypothetical protein
MKRMKKRKKRKKRRLLKKRKNLDKKYLLWVIASKLNTMKDLN